MIPNIISTSSVVDIPCKCDLCSDNNFVSTTELMKHYNTYHFNQMRQCIFLDCNVTFGCGSTSRHHFRLKHKYTGSMKLKHRHLLTLEQPTLPSSVESDVSTSSLEPAPISVESSEEYDDVDFDLIDDPADEQLQGDEQLPQDEQLPGDKQAELDEDYFLQYYSDFLNRLSHFKFIPHSTVQEIAEEYILNTRKSLETRQVLLKKSLDSLTGISQKDKDKILLNVEADTFLKAQIKLDTEYKRSKYIKENKNYSAP